MHIHICICIYIYIYAYINIYNQNYICSLYLLQVNSANDWEHCKLDGETKRHDKFMKLMGAEKVN